MSVCLLCCPPPLQSDANDKFNELEEQLQQIKDQIQVGALAVVVPVVAHTVCMHMELAVDVETGQS